MPPAARRDAMKVTSRLLERLHLDPSHLLLSGRAVLLVKEFFDAIDTRNMEGLDDIGFVAFLCEVTDLDERQALGVFDMLDVDDSGSIEFDEFYLLVCMLVAVKDNMGKQFLWRHSRTCFELLDEDGSKAVSIEEFQTLGALFNISHSAAKRIFREFDVDGSKELDYDEFRMFSLAAIDKQRQLDAAAAKKAEQRAQSVCIIQ